MTREENALLQGVAIIGMAGRFPGANDVAEFWRNQLAGVEAISYFRPEQLEVAGGRELSTRSTYVRARSILADVDLFDAEFFSIYPREAELMDPQHRLFLECCWQALEDAAYDPFTFPGSIGVHAGCSMPTYFLSRLCSTDNFINKFTGGYQVSNYLEMLGNSVDFLSTRVSYKLNLRGPSFTLQAGCSTSLVAVCQAYQSLLTYQCDMALAGGSSITLPQKRGSEYQEGGMISPDGHCRTFDAGANGTVFGSGVGVVLLKRMEDALRGGDQIYAVIRGCALNNDGSSKVGFTAPSVEGQSSVIATAQEAAGVTPDSIGYIEAHGTGTPLGDPIEMAALTKAFRAKTDAKQFCAIGTAKTNVGHLDVAAGVTGLINATNILRHGIFPPTLHFREPNPNFDLHNSPFYVNRESKHWKSEVSPRRAGVSAFGVGGTNAHVILEEPPVQPSGDSHRPAQLLVLSARSERALEQATDNLIEHLKTNPDLSIADVAWSLQVGRRKFAYRRYAAVNNLPDAIEILSHRDRKRVQTRFNPNDGSAVYFLFPGQGSQHPNMGRQIYESEPVFRETIDHCCKILRPHLDADLLPLLYASNEASAEEKRRLTDTILAQPAIFTVEYALAQLWMSWGVRPQGMLGHSVGEFVAACLAGVISLEDALALVAARGRMMQEVPPGGMLSVRLPEARIRPRLNTTLAVAAVNAPSLCVVAGPLGALDSLESELKAEGVAARRLVTSHAFHSPMMDPILDSFSLRVSQIDLRPPQIPFVSSVSGTWISSSEATDPTYWARHVRATVQFSAGVQELLRRDSAILLEVGPGNVLSTLARQHLPELNVDAVKSSQDRPTVISSFGDAGSGQSSSLDLLNAVGSVWAAGPAPQWDALHSGERRRRVSLPTYPFERKRFWLDAPTPTAATSEPAAETGPQMLSEETQQVIHKSRELSAPVQPALSDRTSIISRVISDIFTDLSGIQIESSDASTSFLEMGFDSLFLTQVTQALHARFGIKVTFRQLLGDQSSLKLLTDFIDNQLPAGAFAPEPAPPQLETAPTPVEKPSHPQDQANAIPSAAMQHEAFPNTVANGLDSPVERLLSQQLQAMNQLFAKQLEVLQGASRAPVVIAAPESQANARVTATNDAPSSMGKSASATQDVREFKPFGPFKPPQRGTFAQFTERQQRHIQELIERSTKRTPKSKSLTQRYRSHLADPRVVSGFRSQWKEMVYPILTVRSKDSCLWDVDGNKYIDILNGFGPIMLGHRPDFVEHALEQQLREGFEIGPQSPLAGEVAEAFCEMTGNERMTFCNTGSEAVIAAMRVARTVTGRNKVVLFAGAYHGMFDEVLVKGVKAGETPRSLPIAPGIPRDAVGNVVVLDYGAPEALEWIRNHASELAAVLVEPVQSRHPNLQPIEFLREIRKITQDAGAALIFDEVVTGFRVHQAGCQALFNIRADLATYGKVLAGGMPIGVLAGKSQFMDALDGGAWQFGDDSYPSVGVTFFAGTFVRHPLALAAVKAVLTHFREQGPQLQQRLTAKSASLVRSLNALFEKSNVPSRIESFGSIFYFGFPTDFPLGSLLYYHLRAKGIYVLEGFPCFLTTAHSDADIAEIIRAFDESIKELQAGGILPERANEPTPETKKTATTAPPAEPALSDSTPPVEVPLTEAQMEIWLSAQLGDHASCAFNESLTLLLRGELNKEALQDSLRDLINRHEALRATINPQRNSLRFSPAADFALRFEDFSSTPPNQRAVLLDEAKHQEASTPFDLLNGPMIRLRLLRLDTEAHALLLTTHHIVCDGWSTNVLLDELAALYTASRSSKTPSLPDPLRFSTYAIQQSQNDDQEVANYWLERFEQIPPVLELPTDRPRPAVKTFNGATYRTRVDATTYKQIRHAGAKHGCTLFSTLLTGFVALLHRLTSQNDLVVGIPTAGQSLLEGGNLVGHCVNFLPIRARLIEGQSASELLQQIKRTVLDAYDHQTYTYGTLVRNLKLRRDPSRLPLVEVQFNLEKVGASLDFPGVQVEVDPNPKTAVNFDIFLNIVESEQGLLIDCDYNSDLFDNSTIGRWLTHFETILRAMSVDSLQATDHLPILTDPELHQILSDWNATDHDYPRHKCVHELFEEQVAQYPEAVAASFEHSSLTYAQLDRRANQLANHLVKIGVTPGALVGIALDRSLDLLVGLLGIWKAGAAYLPLDTAYPRDRIASIIEQTSLPFLLTHSKFVPDLPIFDSRPICLDRDSVLIERESPVRPTIELDSSALAYIIFTSGSTGKPKGVEVTHRNVVNLLCSMREKPGMHNRDRLLAVTTLSFDIAALELFLPLITGAQVILAARETAQDPRLLIELMNESRPTVMQATPATWRLLKEVGWKNASGMRMFCGGEALPRQLADELLESGELWNMYGPTETTIWSATSRVEPSEGPVPIGPPIRNTNFYVLDAHLQPLPIGVPGELYIGGDGIAKGYFKNAQLTSERFIPNPFTKSSADRLYKTGDLVRYRPDGQLDFLGRLDNQVKIRGFRIELGEIESILAAHPDVRDCVVATQEDEPGASRLIAYCVPQQPRNCSSEDLRNWLAASLPEYMIPSIFLFMPALPHTPNGKIDRKALVRLDAQSLPQQNLFIAPRTDLEAKLAALCAEVLHLDRVSVHDSFFDLGADSIHLFQIIARAALAGITITPQQILRLRTVSGLAAELGVTASASVDTKHSSEKITRAPREQYQLDAAPQAT